MRAAGPGGSAHCEPARGRGAEGPGSEGGVRLPDAECAVAAAPPQPGGWRAWGGGGRAVGGGRGARRRHQAAPLEPCVRQRHAHTCPPQLPGASLAVRAERARLNFPFILGLGGRARRRRSFPGGLSGTCAASLHPEGAFSRRTWARTVVAPLAVLVKAASVGACHFCPAARSAASWRHLSWRSLGCVPRGRREQNCKKVPTGSFSP